MMDIIRRDKRMALAKKKCKLERCGKGFYPNREWQDFCCKKHQQEYWTTLHKKHRTVESRLDVIEKKLGIK